MEAFPIRATVFRDGHDQFGADAVLITPGGKEFSRARMYDVSPGNSVFEAWAMPNTTGPWTFRIDTWSDPWSTWLHDAGVKIESGVDAELMCEEGAQLMERMATGKIKRTNRPPRTPAYRAAKPNAAAVKQLTEAAEILRNQSIPPLARFNSVTGANIRKIADTYPLRDYIESTEKYPLQVDRRTALYGSWYEVFPRSYGAFQKEDGSWQSGTLNGLVEALPRIADMGFTVLYLTPVHPIGTTFRKGKNNTLEATENDPGSPYGIGSEEGGHAALHPDLGSWEDFDNLVKASNEAGMEVALDLALQDSPDHPWVKEHPEWFTTRADGSIAYAENPPKKYQDIYPLNFDNDPKGLYEEVLRVVRFWVKRGVKVFRVDNPHTKPGNFWEWLIETVHQTNPEVIFLAEAFTAPARLYGLAKAGFAQSYIYFPWKTTKKELTEFGEEIVKHADIARPSLWVNTPDILHEFLVKGGRGAFAIRAALASTMSPLWGMYSGFELYENVPVKEGSEEYLDSEKYQLRHRDYDAALESGDSLEPFITLLNTLRREHPALQQLRTLHFHDIGNDNLLAYSKIDPLTGDAVLVVINLDPWNAQEGILDIDMNSIGRRSTDRMDVEDLITGQRFNWGKENFIRLEPWSNVAHIIQLPDVPEGLRRKLAWRDVPDYEG